MVDLKVINTSDIKSYLKDIDTMDIEVLFAKAVNYYTSVQLPNVAYSLFKKVVERDPNYVHEGDYTAYFYLGKINYQYMEESKLEDILELYSKAIELIPTDGEAYLHRGFVFMDLGEYQNAIDDYEQALKYDDTTPKDLIKVEIEIAKEAFERRKGKIVKLHNFIPIKEVYKIEDRLGIAKPLDLNKMVRSLRDDVEMDQEKIVEIIEGIAEDEDERENLLMVLFENKQ